MSDTLTLGQVHVRRELRPAVLTRDAISSPALLIGAAVMLVSLAVYYATMAPDLYSLDSPELTAAAHSLGIAHAPGYPLYTMTGWLFSHAFPIDTVAFRLNLLSALLGAAACTVTYVIGLRFTTRPLVAAAGALALGFSYYFWLDALAAEVYTLDALLFAGLILAALVWRDQPDTTRAIILGLVLGMALATRTTILLALPALAAFAWLAGAHSPRTYVAAGGAALATATLVYLYLPLRSAAGVSFGPGDYAADGSLSVIDLTSLSGLWRHLSAEQFRAEAFAYGPIAALRQAASFGGWLGAAVLGVGIPLGIAGLARQWRRDRAGLILFAGMALPIALFFINYGAIDKKFMFLPVYVVWSLWMVAGMDWALELAGVVDAPWLVLTALALPAVALAVNWPLVNLRGEHEVRQEGEAILQTVAPGAIVYGRFTDVAPLQYLQQVEGQRPDVKLVNSWTAEESFLVELAAANVGRVPFYMTQEDARVCAQYQCVPVGSAVEVRPRD